MADNAPPVPPATPPVVPPVKPALDPFRASLMKSLELTVPPDAPAPPVVEEETFYQTPPLGDVVVQSRKRQAEPPAATPPSVPPAEPPAAPAAVVPPAEPPKPQIVVRKVPPTAPAAPAPAPAPVPPPATTPAVPEPLLTAEFENALSDEEKEELALARFAEKNGRPGIEKEMCEYLKKIDTYFAENPDADPKGDEFQQFNQAAYPKWSDSQKKKMERAMIREEAKTMALQEVAPVVQQQALRIKEIEARPVINEAIAKATTTLTAQPENKELVGIDPEVVKMIDEQGIDAAVKKYKVEAPIVHFTRTASKQWMELTNGLRAYNEADPVDRWLFEFMRNQTQHFASMPPEQQAQFFGGRRFLPLDQYSKMRRENPEQLHLYATMTNEQIVEMIANQGVLQVNHEYKSLEESGFKREPKKVSTVAVSQPPPPAAPPAPPTTGAPKAGGSSIPGAADVVPVKPPANDFIQKLVPGWTPEGGIPAPR